MFPSSARISVKGQKFPVLELNTDANNAFNRDGRIDHRRVSLPGRKGHRPVVGDGSQSATVTGSSDVGSPPSNQRTPENPRNRTLCSARTGSEVGKNPVGIFGWHGIHSLELESIYMNSHPEKRPEESVALLSIVNSPPTPSPSTSQSLLPSGFWKIFSITSSRASLIPGSSANRNFTRNAQKNKKK
ncbi:hypothetical protein TNCV_1581651 [Trichonephila clavipes]|nr:hypothetical protein TNCV_1581651 [Trichonephila clavipes]